MVRMLVTLFCVVMLISCGGDKRALKTIALSGSAPNSAYQGDSSDPLADGTADTQKVSSADEEKKNEIISAVRGLKYLLDASILNSVPTRVSGQLITNKTPDTELRSLVPDDLLFEMQNQRVSNSDSDKSAYDKIMELTEKKMSLAFELKARLVPTGSLAQTIRATETLIKVPESIQSNDASTLIPIKIEMSPNFFKSNAVIVTKDFYAKLKIYTDGPKQGRFSHFELMDSSYKPVGKIIIPLTNSTKTEDQKMIIQFASKPDQNFDSIEKLEYVGVLQMGVVDFVIKK